MQNHAHAVADEHEVAMRIDKARDRLGFEPVHLWRQEYAATPQPAS